MEQKTIEYQLSHDQWKLYFSRFADKNKYMIYVIVILVAFVVVYSLCLNQMNAGIGDEFMYLLFAAFAAAFVYFFIKFLRGSMPGPQAARYEKQLEQQFGTAALHYTITFESRRLVYCAQESRQKLFIPYASIRRVSAGRGLVCIQSEPDGKPVNVVLPEDAVKGGAAALTAFLQAKNPDCKVRHL